MKKKTLISWWKLIFGCILLFNPNINLIDVMPDALGYLLLLLAIQSASDTFPHFDEAYSAFYKLFWINLAKLPALYIMLSVFAINSYERSIITVFALAFAVLEIIFALPGFRALLEGFAHLGQSEGLMPALKAGAHKRGIDGVTLWTVVFLVTKAICSALPEFSLISVFETLGSLDPGAINPARLYPFFAAVGAVVSLVIGGVWLYYTVSYFRALRKSAVMSEFLAQKETACRDAVSARAAHRRERITLYLLAAALLFAFDLILDEKNYLPDILSAICFTVCFLFLGRRTRGARLGLISSALYAASTVARMVAESKYFSLYEYEDVAYRAGAKYLYTFVGVFAVLEAVFLIALILSLFFAMRDFVAHHAGEAMNERNRSVVLSLHKELLVKLRAFTALGILCALFHVAEVFLLTLTEKHIVTADEANQFYAEGDAVYYSVFGGSWLLGFAVTAIWVASGFYFLYSLRSEMMRDEE
jgi:hypothetical protein